MTINNPIIPYCVCKYKSLKLEYKYKVGFINGDTEDIIIVLENFEEWLTLFWNANKNSDELVSVFHSMYPEWEDREDLLQSGWDND